MSTDFFNVNFWSSVIKYLSKIYRNRIFFTQLDVRSSDTFADRYSSY